MGIDIGKPTYEKDGGSFEVSIQYDVGDPQCQHDWSIAELLLIKRCKKCGRMEEYHEGEKP